MPTEKAMGDKFNDMLDGEAPEGKSNGGRKKTKEPPMVKLKDDLEIALVIVYMVQKMGKPTLTRLKAAIKEKIRSSIHQSTLTRVAQGCAKGDFIAIERQQGEEGLVETCYSMKKVGIWKAPPEYAYIKDLLPRLLETEMATRIKAWFEQQEGAGSTKTKRGNVYDKYHIFEVDVITTDPLIGALIKCQHIDRVAEKHPTDIQTKVSMGKRKKKGGKEEEVIIELEGLFHRDEFTGEYIIHADVLSGWFGTNAARYCGLPPASADYIGFSPIRITPKENSVTQMVLPTQGQNGPSAPKAYECLEPGQEFTIRFIAPTKGMLPVEAYEFLFIVAGLRPRRGLSPARGKRFGRFLTKGFRDLGPLGNGVGVSFLLDEVQEPLMEAHGDYLLEAADRLKNINFTPPKAPEPEEFPSSDQS